MRITRFCMPVEDKIDVSLEDEIDVSVEDKIDVSLSPFMSSGIDPQYDRYVNPDLIELAIRKPEDTDNESQAAAATRNDRVRRADGIFGERGLALFQKSRSAPVCDKTEELSEKLLAFLGKYLSLTTFSLTESKESILNYV